MLQELRAETYNNPCKDDIDRGGVGNGYLFLNLLKLLAIEQKELSSALVREAEGVLFAPALTVKKREVIKHRFNDLTNALKTLDYWKHSIAVR